MRPFPEPHSGPSSVLVDELNARLLEGATKGSFVRGRDSYLAFDYFHAPNSRYPHFARICQVARAPTQERASRSQLSTRKSLTGR